MNNIHLLLERLWADYLNDCPYAVQYLVDKTLSGQEVINDHIAFRTVHLGSDRKEPFSGIHPLKRMFEWLGYNIINEYEFPDKNLYAIHMECNELPKIFISQYETWKLNEKQKEFVIGQFQSDDSTGLLEGRNPTPDLLHLVFKFNHAVMKEMIQPLENISQYLSWVYVFGNKPNHFTALVNDIEQEVEVMKNLNIPMKKEIEGEKGSKLRQTSTEASKLFVRAFDIDNKPILIERPYAYFELAQRNNFNGFLGQQATNLFEMTKPKE